MGGKVSKTVVSKVTKPVKNYNIENRAQRRLKKQSENPAEYAAPRHPSTVEIMKQQSAENPEIQEELAKQDPSLVDRVNRLKLETMDEFPKILRSAERPLPQGRDAVLDPLEAFVNPEKIPKGKMSLVQIVTILKEHETDPAKYSSEIIANDYNIEQSKVDSIIKYYKQIVVKVDAEGKAKEHASTDENEMMQNVESRFKNYRNFVKDNDERKENRNISRDKDSIV